MITTHTKLNSLLINSRYLVLATLETQGRKTLADQSIL